MLFIHDAAYTADEAVHPPINLLFLRLPNPLHSLGNTYVVGLELIKADRGQESGDPEQPLRARSCLRYALLGEVVDDARPMNTPLASSLPYVEQQHGADL